MVNFGRVERKQEHANYKNEYFLEGLTPSLQTPLFIQNKWTKENKIFFQRMLYCWEIYVLYGHYPSYVMIVPGKFSSKNLLKTQSAASSSVSGWGKGSIGLTTYLGATV